ncbi:hypothetical protein DIPPA_21651 [Diplonema papillatum]|nr:hypothetical protein DIPPA_21651 [Diplonema papillatum]
MVRLVGDAWSPDEGLSVDIPLAEPLANHMLTICDELCVDSDMMEYTMWSVEAGEVSHIQELHTHSHLHTHK